MIFYIGVFLFLILMGILFVAPNAFSMLLTPVFYLMGWADTFIRLWI